MKFCEHKNARSYAVTRETHTLRDGTILAYDVTHLQCIQCRNLFSRIAEADLSRGAA